MPSAIGVYPIPYFVERKDGSIGIQKPVFLCRGPGLPINRYILSGRTFEDFSRFLLNVGIPLIIHDDLNRLLFAVKKLSNRVPVPSQNTEKIERAVFSELDQLCISHHSKMVVVAIGNVLDKKHWLREFPNLILVDAEKELRRQVDFVPGRYQTRYGFTWGSPLRRQDPHPNPLAHRIIADEIMKTLNRSI
jgi:hypothetical protein